MLALQHFYASGEQLKKRPPNHIIRFHWHALYEIKSFFQQPSSASLRKVQLLPQTCSRKSSIVTLSALIPSFCIARKSSIAYTNMLSWTKAVTIVFQETRLPSGISSKIFQADSTLPFLIKPAINKFCEHDSLL